jgi:hypothetical protein
MTSWPIGRGSVVELGDDTTPRAFFLGPRKRACLASVGVTSVETTGKRLVAPNTLPLSSPPCIDCPIKLPII